MAASAGLSADRSHDGPLEVSNESSTSARPFTLGLECLDFEGPQGFRVFPGMQSGEAPGWVFAAEEQPSVLSKSLEPSAAGNVLPDHMRMTLRERPWDELDPWEKAGLVMSHTAVADGVEYLLYRIFD